LGIAVLVTAFIPLWQFPTWQKSEQEKADLLAAIAPMPEGSRLFWAHAGLRSPEVVKTEIGAYHIGAYAVIAKRALVQSMFVYPGQQPIRFRGPAYQNAPRNSTTFLVELIKIFRRLGVDFTSHLLSFDYLLMHGPNEQLEERVLPLDRLRLVDRVGEFRLYAVLKSRPAVPARRTDLRHRRLMSAEEIGGRSRWPILS